MTSPEYKGTCFPHVKEWPREGGGDLSAASTTLRHVGVLSVLQFTDIACLKLRVPWR